MSTCHLYYHSEVFVCNKMYHVIAWRFQIYKAYKNDFNNLIISKKMFSVDSYLFILITWFKCYGCWTNSTQHYRLGDCCNDNENERFCELLINSLPIFRVASLPRTAISGVLSYMNFMNQVTYEHSDCAYIATSIAYWYYRLSNIPVWIWLFEFNVSHSILYM